MAGVELYLNGWESPFRHTVTDREGRFRFEGLVDEGDYFQFLGVGPDAGAAEVKQAHERLSRELSDATLGPDVARELARELGEIRAVLAEARQILENDETREAYRSAAHGRREAGERRPG